MKIRLTLEVKRRKAPEPIATENTSDTEVSEEVVKPRIVGFGFQSEED